MSSLALADNKFDRVPELAIPQAVIIGLLVLTPARAYSNYSFYPSIHTEKHLVVLSACAHRRVEQPFVSADA